MDRVLTVKSFEIYKGSIYKINPKYHASAPDGFRQLGTTKVLGGGIVDEISCPFTDNGTNSGEGIYDTGFYVGSQCNRHLSKSEELVFIQAVTELIVEPYERKHGEGILRFSNFDFWDNYRVDLYHNRVFNPDNVDHLLALYIGLISHELTPVKQEGKPAFRNSAFLIEDITKAVDFTRKKSNNIVSSIGVFSGLMKNKPTVLYDILRYCKMIDNNVNVSENVLNDTFYRWLTSTDNSLARIAAFNSAVELANDPNTSDVPAIFSKLIVDFRTGRVTKSGGFFYFQNTQIGSSLREAARVINADPDKQAIKEVLLMGE